MNGPGDSSRGERGVGVDLGVVVCEIASGADCDAEVCSADGVFSLGDGFGFSSSFIFINHPVINSSTVANLRLDNLPREPTKVVSPET